MDPLDTNNNAMGASMRAASTAKYIEGCVRMQCTGKLRKISTPRNGVLVINLSDGTLTFYRVPKTGSQYNKHFKCLDAENHGGGIAEILTGKGLSWDIDLDPRHLLKTDKVSIFVSNQDFVETVDMPMAYLRIPGSVPWKLKTFSNNVLKQGFQIVVPPLPDGTPDNRVWTMRYRDKIKQLMRKSSTFEEKNGTLIVSEIDSDSVLGAESTVAGLVSETLSHTSNASQSQIFSFFCHNDKEIAVYMATAQKLKRVGPEGNAHSMSLIPSTNRRLRTRESMEIAEKTQLLESGAKSTKRLTSSRRVDSIGKEEFKCYPLYAYPFRWMTKDELAVELERSSKNIQDFTSGSPDEIGRLLVEVLQCNGLPKLDTYSLSDAMCYVVCESNAFVTDVIPDNLNPAWLPLSRRACMLPIRNAYSQVYVGCFDYDGENDMDDFIGRVVIDLPQLQAGITYDVTLPLRKTSRSYKRKNLGSIRLRLHLNWTRGERAALRSYLPATSSGLIKNGGLRTPVVVACPDKKSFYNVVHTVYGKDMPGKFSIGTINAVFRELEMMGRLSFYIAKKTLEDVLKWANPFVSGYIFFGWMYCVADCSLRCIPSFVFTLVLMLLLRNYLKYNVNSAAGCLYGHKTIGDMVQTLLFDRDDSKAKLSDIHRRSNMNMREKFFSWIFGMSAQAADPNIFWNSEDHSEFPFSIGSIYPKLSISNTIKPHIGKKFEAPVPHAISDAMEALCWDSDDNDSIDADLFFDNYDDDDGDEHEPFKIANTLKKVSMELAAPFTLDSTNTTNEAAGSMKAKKMSVLDYTLAKTLNKFSSDTTNDGYIPINLGCGAPIGSIPDQNLKTRIKYPTSMIQGAINKLHDDVQSATGYMFDDRVFLANECDEYEKLLKYNKNRNPLLAKLAPTIMCAIKSIDVGLCFARSLFNIFMWKDPFLSFLCMVSVSCVVLILFIFPWQKFFFLVGLIGVGPQNWVLAKWGWSWIEKFTAPNTAFSKEESYFRKSSIQSTESSPLLLRNNTQMKPDKKAVDVIVPSAPFRHNRFYDWPPDPSVATMKTSDYNDHTLRFRKRSHVESENDSC